MGVKTRKKIEPEYYEEKSRYIDNKIIVFSICKWCSADIVIQNEDYCNSFCEFADKYGIKLALDTWTTL